MFKIDPMDCITTQEKMLFNIMEMVRMSRFEELKEEVEPLKISTIKCSKCGKLFENKGQLMAHHKTDHKKE